MNRSDTRLAFKGDIYLCIRLVLLVATPFEQLSKKSI